MKIKLTQYSHGAGCGCKISPQILEEILGQNSPAMEQFQQLVVGNESKDDAAVYDIGDGRGIISTTDFFMPIVDDPFDFGWIASANALSDVYAMGGKPLMAIAILGWPVSTIPPEIAGTVLEGARAVCKEAGIPLAGGHSIDTTEPIFGLAVTGEVSLARLKRNNSACPGCDLYLTKPLGVGILSTAEKKAALRPEHVGVAAAEMKRLNYAGNIFSEFEFVKAMTDVTGFGLMGHLLEMCQGSALSAELIYEHIPRLPGVFDYLAQGIYPGGTERNLASYQGEFHCDDHLARLLLADPQTSGGLLIAVDGQRSQDFEAIAKENEIKVWRIGNLVKQSVPRIVVK